MRIWVIYGCLLLCSCGQEPKEPAAPTLSTDTAIVASAPAAASDTNKADLDFANDETPEEKPPAPPPVKRPLGVYRFMLSDETGEKILHTISFSPGAFRLQEEYGTQKDSIVITEGTWAPSRDFIWLYKDQVMRGRYTWQGDTLQYYSPRLKEKFPMRKLEPAAGNDLWQRKRADGALLYAVGTEPFWNAEITGQDTLVVNMPDWNAPLRLPVNAASTTTDSTVYKTENDSVRVTVYPLFCSDGMSDFLYTKKVTLTYKGQSYRGCGESFRTAF